MRMEEMRTNFVLPIEVPQCSGVPLDCSQYLSNHAAIREDGRDEDELLHSGGHCGIHKIDRSNVVDLVFKTNKQLRLVRPNYSKLHK